MECNVRHPVVRIRLAPRGRANENDIFAVESPVRRTEAIVFRVDMAKQNCFYFPVRRSGEETSATMLDLAYGASGFAPMDQYLFDS